jgi:predicted SAM-dependent methyltransferase
MRLNLGCGHNRKPGWVNVDEYGDPDVRHDLETFPWPWPDESIEAIELVHVLEHLGQAVDVYLKIFQEMYRISKPLCDILIIVPHPRHDNFLDDPTHVRAVTPLGLQLFNQRMNDYWRRGNYSNSPLGQYLGVDFEMVGHLENEAKGWQQHAGAKERNFHINTVVESKFLLKVMKPQRFPLEQEPS